MTIFHDSNLFVFKAIIECCKILNSNLEPVRKIMPPKYTWLDLITKAFNMGVDLTAHYWLYPADIQTPFQCKLEQNEIE